MKKIQDFIWVLYWRNFCPFTASAILFEWQDYRTPTERVKHLKCAVSEIHPNCFEGPDRRACEPVTDGQVTQMWVLHITMHHVSLIGGKASMMWAFFSLDWQFLRKTFQKGWVSKCFLPSEGLFLKNTCWRKGVVSNSGSSYPCANTVTDHLGTSLIDESLIPTQPIPSSAFVFHFLHSTSVEKPDTDNGRNSNQPWKVQSEVWVLNY